MLSLTQIPKKPGCYFFKDKHNNIIYIGKAKNLFKRVSSYFQKKDHDPKTTLLVSNITNIDFIVTDTEVEALILENNLIKKHTPKYNIDLKDSKRFAFIQITDEDFPRVLLARKRIGSGRFFGPFTSGETRDYIISTVNKMFQLRTCRRLPKRACLRYHIKLCRAPCINKITKREYWDTINKVEMLLSGKTKSVTKILTAEMKQAAEKEEYELALERRKQIESIEWLNDKQKMERDKNYNEDILNYTIRDSHVYLMLFNISKGTLINKQEYDFEYHENFIEDFLVQYYSENSVPKELNLPKIIDIAIIDFLKQKRRKQEENKRLSFNINIPKIGDKKQLLDLISINIEATFFGDTSILEDLKKKLRLQEHPKIIECFDISHLSGTSMVASMVQFRNAKPDKNNYRRFKIRTVHGIDDFKAIGEVVRRRYARLVSERAQLPDLIVIDGGKGQLTSALKELAKFGLHIPTIGLAKKFEEIYVPGLRAPLILDKKSKALKLLQNIRDEAHRFAISYNRLLRKKKLVKD